MDRVYVATIQVALRCDTEDEACAAVSEALTENLCRDRSSCFIDWQYLKVGGQFLAPTERQVTDRNQLQDGEVF